MPDRTARTISCARPGGVDEGAPAEPGDGPQVHLARIRAEGTFDGVAQGQLSLIPGSLVRVRPAVARNACPPLAWPGRQAVVAIRRACRQPAS
jgi:hypothetical protein